LTCGVITGIFSLMILLSDSFSLPVHSSLIHTYFIHDETVTNQ